MSAARAKPAGFLALQTPMSVLGHKQTFALQNVMSPIATLIAYFGMLAKDLAGAT
jgi:hypothetical protein